MRLRPPAKATSIRTQSQSTPAQSTTECLRAAAAKQDSSASPAAEQSETAWSSLPRSSFASARKEERARADPTSPRHQTPLQSAHDHDESGPQSPAATPLLPRRQTQTSAARTCASALYSLPRNWQQQQPLPPSPPRASQRQMHTSAVAPQERPGTFPPPLPKPFVF